MLVEPNIWWRLFLPLSRLVTWLGFKVRYLNLDAVPERGPVIVAANHVSFLDPIIIPTGIWRACRRPTRYLAAAEFFKSGLIGWGLRTMGQIPIRRGESDSGAMATAAETLQAGALLGIFPEGKINDTPDTMLAGRRGAARLALETGAPIVPMGIWGTQYRLPRGGVLWRKPWRMPIVLIAGDPITVDHVEHVPEEHALIELTDKLMVAIEALRERARAMSGLA
jgi:1-acyl-sn-glycerol-3-phosphate acyltransferase